MWRQLLTGVLLALLAGCASLPSLDGRSETRAVTDTADTALGRAVAPRAAANPGKAGIYAIPLAHDAFAARVLLARTAEKSLDLQYYVWHGDQTGTLLFEAVRQAADRGVRVRMLLDDANTSGLDDTILALDAHPNIEIRLYNPMMLRSNRLLNFATDFSRVNRRMHNKSFTADNQVTIVGGRNVGNEYFGVGPGVEFSDLDVIAVGPVVQEVSRAFDLYWNSASAYPAASVIGNPGRDVGAALDAKFAAVHADPEAAAYIQTLRETKLLQQIAGGQLPLEWVEARVVRDDPAKTLDPTPEKSVLLLAQVLPLMGPPQSSLDLVSPYFVPGEGGTAALVDLAQRGNKVRVLTNSLAATDVSPVHAGYVKRRCDLLRAGVKLYELKPSAETAHERTARAGSSPGPGSGSSPGSGSAVQLHAKTSAVDQKRVFVGSFNFDERSAFLNTEMGLVIESPALAQRLSAAFDSDIPLKAYEVRIAADGQCPEWIERTPEGEVRYDVEPQTGAGQRSWIQFLTILPIDWML